MTITGALLRNAVIYAAQLITSHRQEIDALNVFPVPDGDTGTNMSMTITNAAREVRVKDDSENVSAVASCVASGLLRGARGNSGVILSLIFRGFSKGLKGLEEADGAAMASALEHGSSSAYKAVMKPTEGTILTVIRTASEYARKAVNDGETDAVKVFDIGLEGAKAALADTPNILPVLKKAGVVDAGGSGLVCIFTAMSDVFHGKEVNLDAEEAEEAKSEEKADDHPVDNRYTYCAEFISRRDNDRDIRELRAYLEAIGECVSVTDDGRDITVHVHTNAPGKAIQKGIEFGQLTNIKVENMHQEHQNAAWGAAPKNQPEPMKIVEPTKPFGYVAVASGEGLCELFSELGADQIVSGGQTMNPSTDDLLKAVLSTPAEHVFILPNNKNIIMAAEQVDPLTDRDVRVLHTKTIPQGIAALLNVDDSLSAEENHLTMMKAAEKVSTGLVTFAARDSSIDGQSVREGQILGMENGKITTIESNIIQAAFKVTKHLFKRGSSSLVTLIYGNGASEEDAEELASLLTAKFGSDIEVSVINGGQPVYYFIISVEQDEARY